MKQSVQIVTASVMLFPGYNPGPNTLQGTNTYLLGQGRAKLLVDPAEGHQRQVGQLRAHLKQTESALSELLITHHHHDHVIGIKNWVGEVKKIYKGAFHQKDKLIQKQYGFQYSYCTHGSKVPSGAGVALTAVATPGHCSDHCSFWWEQQKVLLTGDCVLGNLADYMASLQKLLELPAQVLLPGHGPVVFGRQACRQRIQQVKENRLTRERDLVECLKSGEKSLEQMFDQVYKGTPQQLKGSAVNNIRCHMLKLVREGAVSETAPGIFKLDER